MALHFKGVEGFEITIVRGMKRDQDRHDFAQTQAATPHAVVNTLGEQSLLPEAVSIGVGATRGRTNRVVRKISRIQACVHSLFPDSPGVLSNERV
jgi:hypothetical protein